jgi:two-component system sensor kinase FixL
MLIRPFVLDDSQIAAETQARVKLSAGLIGASIIVMSVLVLFGWAIDEPRLKSIVPGWQTMKANTALLFLLTGFALIAASRNWQHRKYERYARVAGAVVALVGLLTLAEYIFGVDLDIDQLLCLDHETVAAKYPGRMAPATAMAFSMLGSALAVVYLARWSQLYFFNLLMVGLLGLVCLVGYVYGTSSLYTLRPFSSVALHTVMMFALACIAGVCLRPETGLPALLLSRSAGGLVARLLLPVAFCVPLLFGWFRLLAHRYGNVDVPVGIALFACSNVIVVTCVTYWCAKSIERNDIRRQQSEAGFRQVVESAPNAMILVDCNGRMTMVNEQTEKLFEFPRTRLLGHSIELLVPEELRDAHVGHRTAYFAAAVGRPMGDNRELYGRRRSGALFPVEVGLSPIWIGSEPFVLCSIVDITQRLSVEQRERSHLAELAHAGRLSTVGEMISGLAHEINQPLAAASNYARACVRLVNAGSGLAIPQISELVEKTLAQTERANQIVNRMCSFVRKGVPTKTEVDINQVVTDVISLSIPSTWLKTTNSDHLAVRVESERCMPIVRCDRVQIEQVLVNLVRNAVDAMQDCSPDTRQLAITSSQNTDGIVVAVDDNGPGVATELASRIFDPFFTTKPDGIGLGLSLSHSIIEAHGGRFWYEPRAGGGARFAFWLPCGITKEAAA